MHIAATDVESIKAGRPIRGLLWGFLIGAAAGELVGVMAFAATDDESFEKLLALYYLVIGPIAGGLVGSLIGPFTTADIYRLEMDGSE